MLKLNLKLTYNSQQNGQEHALNNYKIVRYLEQQKKGVVGILWKRKVLTWLISKLQDDM